MFLCNLTDEGAEGESNADDDARELDEDAVRLEELLDDMGLDEEEDEPEPDVDNGEGLPLSALAEGDEEENESASAPKTVFDASNFKPSEMKFL